jgi:hypothetical protein
LFINEEVRNSRFLQTAYWTLLIGFYLAFSYWLDSSHITWNSQSRAFDICPAYFQSCEDWYFWKKWDFFYFKEALFGVLFSLLTASALAAYFKNWKLAVYSLLPLVAFKIYYVFFLTSWAIAEYEYFHIPIVLALIFCYQKKFAMRFVFILVYFLSALAKLNEAWIVGTDFTALKGGLPFFSFSMIPYLTNGLILFEIISPWFLISKNRKLRYLVIGAWTALHLYSILFVGSMYAMYCLPLLFCLFLPDPDPISDFKIKSVKNLALWLIVTTLLVLTLIPWLIPVDRSATLQGRRLGIQMFNANHQCESSQNFFYKDGSLKSELYTNTGSMSRCAPYPLFYILKKRCSEENLMSIRWKFYSSLNGGPFFEMVNTENLCDLTYREFSKNEWIKDDFNQLPAAGYPRKNSFGHQPLVNGPSIMHNSPDPEFVLTDTQKFLSQNLELFKLLYFVLSLIVVAVVVFRLRFNFQKGGADDQSV